MRRFRRAHSPVARAGPAPVPSPESRPAEARLTRREAPKTGSGAPRSSRASDTAPENTFNWRGESLTTPQPRASTRSGSGDVALFALDEMRRAVARAYHRVTPRSLPEGFIRISRRCFESG